LIIQYLPFGVCLQSPNIPTDKLFTGQRLDSTGLYYYNARYYDPTIGRFISPDTVIQNLANPQCLNRYSYCLNNPLKYTDPSGRNVTIDGIDFANTPAWLIAQMMTSASPSTVQTIQKVLPVYVAFRDNNNIWTLWAETMEKSTTHDINITAGNIGSGEAYNVQPEGNDWTITLNTNVRNNILITDPTDLTSTESFQSAGSFSSIISDNILVTRPGFNSSTNWKNIFGIIPGLEGVIGTIQDAFSEAQDAKDDAQLFSDVVHGKFDLDDFMILVGQTGGIGDIASFFYDAIELQVQFDQQAAERGSESNNYQYYNFK
jgi:RHS repeat-associated protein